MSTSDIKKKIKQFLIITIVTLLFSIIYEYFSFGVISKYMILAPLIPLILGVLTYLLLLKNEKVGYIESSMYSNGVYTLLIGSILQGVLEIYGTTNKLMIIYLVVGIGLIFISLIIYIKKLKNIYKNNKIC